MASFEVAWDEAGAILITRVRSPMAATDVVEYRVTLDEQLGRPNERYFADEGSALSWLAQR